MKKKKKKRGWKKNGNNTKNGNVKCLELHLLPPYNTLRTTLYLCTKNSTNMQQLYGF